MHVREGYAYSKGTLILESRKFGNRFLIYFQTITLDGGEFRSLAGEFNKLRMVPPEMWDMMEKMIRSTNKKSKV